MKTQLNRRWIILLDEGIIKKIATGERYMKTLFFIGSPRKKGNTSMLVDELVKRLVGDVKIYRAYDVNVRPCIDCRFCWKNNGCSIKDGMQEIYEDIQEADNIVIASPIYFSELTGQLLAVLSRFRPFGVLNITGMKSLCLKRKRAV